MHCATDHPPWVGHHFSCLDVRSWNKAAYLRSRSRKSPASSSRVRATCSAISNSSQPADQQLAFVNHLGRKMGVQKDKQLLVADHFFFPGWAINFLQFIKLLFRKIETGPVHVLVKRRPSDRSFLRARSPM